MNECLYAGGNEDSVSTSAPMILRSACLHRRTPERSCHDCSHISSSNGTNIYSITSDTSIEKQKHKSSDLKIKCTDSHSQRILSKSKISEETELSSKSQGEKSSYSTLRGFSIFNSSSDSAFANFLNLKLCSSNSSNAENTRRELVPSEQVEEMSRTSYTRSSISSNRDIIPDLLEYEHESASVYNRARSRTSSSYANSSAFAQFESKVGSHLNSSLSQHNSSGSLTTFKENMLEFIRWLLWKCIYIQILKIQRFDIWLLSRISSIGKFRTCAAIITLPLFIWLFSSVVQQETNGWIVSSISTLNRGFSYLRPSLAPYSTSEEHEHVPPGSCTSSSGIHYLTNLFTIPSYILSFFQKYENPVSESASSTTQHTETVYQVTKDEIKSLVAEAWEEKASDIIKTMNSNVASNVDITKMRNNQEGGIKDELSKLHTEFKSLADDIKLLQKKMFESLQRTEAFSASSTKQNETLQQFDKKIIQMEKKIEDLDHLILLLKDCCSKHFNATDFYSAFETHLTSALRNISNEDSSTSSSYNFFREWLDSKFITDNYLKSNIESAVETLKKDSKTVNEETYTKKMNSIIESIVKQHIGSIKAQILNEGIKLSGQTNFNAFSLSDVNRAIKDAIMLYDADKNGLVDYALESGGGSVLGTRCSETFSEKNARFSILGLPLWYSSNSPRTAIQPAVHPGDCWAFKGTQGFLVIQLSAAVRVKGFSLEHIPVSLSPTGNIDSAPKEFSVWGLVSEKDSVGNLLGKYVYDKSGEPLQYFEVQETYDELFSFVELKIHSNHGNPDYTCLYRIRVHGSRT